MFQKDLRTAALLLLALFSTAVLIVDALVPEVNNGGRRAFLESVAAGGSFSAVAFFGAPALAEQEAEYRQGNKVTPFNGLAFNYRGGDFGGLDASEINEPTVSYKDFNEKLKAGEVAFVEFMAPDGDIAYVTFKNDENNRKIRIGEGYPIEQHDGFSSPMFCVRAVQDAGVKYKFSVKGLTNNFVPSQ
eukprot:CAMPEP_0194142390 /NCGR_PEP_ID=MMETSP0152-20130528/11649_1 /TAXON_ID=1049557 /ORGANISM="Thalassiothrix antarctica, Strain L6-D1" /LENGTH=187 /DNA_ID=CAMNT_0038841315 /DNA_START=86 /DNA_END=649 /DNA_ORIENTATION=+